MVILAGFYPRKQRVMKLRLFELVFALSVFCATFAQAETSQESLSTSKWEEIGNEYGLDWRAIYAISLKESQRSTAEIVHPWPWSVNSPKGGCFCDTKQEAANKIKELMEMGERSIDVGLMQVNFYWHGDKVAGDIYSLLDVETNIRVGASILRTALTSTDDVILGMGRYHSYTEHRARQYGADAYRYFAALLKFDLQ